jgi:hypothetical protein
MLTIEEIGIRIRCAVLDLNKLSAGQRSEHPEIAAEIERIANKITDAVNGREVNSGEDHSVSGA